MLHGLDDLPRTHEDAKALVGTMRQTSESSGPVNEAMIKYFASASEDANRSYWDAEFAEEQWGAVISPPSMLVHWVLPPPWSPGEPSGGHLAPQILTARVPLPGDTVVNISVDYSYIRPVRVGDRLRMEEELVDVSPEKTTRLPSCGLAVVWTYLLARLVAVPASAPRSTETFEHAEGVARSH